MLVRNIDFEGILISRVVLCFDRKIVLSGFSVIQEKRNRVRCFQGPGFVVFAGLCTFDGGDLSAVGIGADNGHFVWQIPLGQLVVIHGIRRFRLLILAENLSFAAVIEDIAHLQRYIISKMQNDFKVSRMPVCKGGNRNPIGIGGFPLRHFHLQPTLSIPPIQLAALGGRIGGIAGAHNSRARALGVRADQLHLVAYPATGQLIVLDFIRGAATRQTEQCAFVVSGSLPCKGKLYIRELLIRNFIPEKHVPLRGSDCEGNLVDLLVRSRRRRHGQRPPRPGQLLCRLGGFGDGNAAHDLCILRLCSGQAYAKPEQVLVQLIAAYGKRLRIARGTGNALCVPGQNQRQLRGRNFPAVGALISVLLTVVSVVRGRIRPGLFRTGFRGS